MPASLSRRKIVPMRDPGLLGLIEAVERANASAIRGWAPDSPPDRFRGRRILASIQERALHRARRGFVR